MSGGQGQRQSQPEQENWPEEVEAAVWRRRLSTPTGPLLPRRDEPAARWGGQAWGRIEPRPWQSEVAQMGAVGERHTSQAGARNMCAAADRPAGEGSLSEGWRKRARRPTGWAQPDKQQWADAE